MRQRDDIASGEVWPEWCEECETEGHTWPTCPKNPNRESDQRRHWRQQKSRYGKDPGLFS